MVPDSGFMKQMKKPQQWSVLLYSNWEAVDNRTEHSHIVTVVWNFPRL